MATATSRTTPSKNELFYLQISQLSRSERQRSIPNENSSRSPKYAELGHFTFRCAEHGKEM